MDTRAHSNLPPTMSTFRPRLPRLAALLLALPLLLQAQQAPSQQQPAAEAEQKTPHRLIAQLGIEIRRLLEDPKASRTPEQAEQAVADQIAALIARSPGDQSLTQADVRGRTPLMQAVSDAYPLVVKALLADADVKFQINAVDRQGESAWMLANFVPTVTLAACQPGVLTRERAVLLPPYLRRMSTLLRSNAAGPIDILASLQAAGAVGDRDALRSAWLTRCPNAAPELRQALAGDADLMATLINDAIARQLAFNKRVGDGAADVPSAPPADMRFVNLPERADDRSSARKPVSPLLTMAQIRCPRMTKPELPGPLNWRGELTLKAIVATRAGVVEAVDFEVKSPTRDKVAVNYFRAVVLRALAGYQCEGELLFEQEFSFKVS